MIDIAAVKVIAGDLWPNMDIETVRISKIELPPKRAGLQPHAHLEKVEDAVSHSADIHYCGDYALAYFPESHELCVGLSAELRRHLRERWQ
jgi:hypothetical protein